MKKLIITALLAASFLASPVIANAGFSPPGAPCVTAKQDAETIKKNVPNAQFGKFEGEELKKFLDKFNSIAARFGQHVDEKSTVWFAKTESRVGYSIYDTKGCRTYYEIVDKDTWNKFMDAVFGGAEG